MSGKLTPQLPYDITLPCGCVLTIHAVYGRCGQATITRCEQHRTDAADQPSEGDQ